MRRPGQVGLTIMPISLKAATEYVRLWHRHHPKVAGAKFAISVEDELGGLRGVVLVGRPKAAAWDQRRTIAEATRAATDGCPNANSALYGAAWRAAKGMGFLTVVTYTEAGESGASLRAAGYRLVAIRPARGNWHESTRDERLRAMRDALGRGGIERRLWAIGAPLPEEMR